MCQNYSPIPCSHLDPVHPGRHIQTSPLIPSKHVPPFKQLIWHSTKSENHTFVQRCRCVWVHIGDIVQKHIRADDTFVKRTLLTSVQTFVQTALFICIDDISMQRTHLCRRHICADDTFVQTTHLCRQHIFAENTFVQTIYFCRQHIFADNYFVQTT